MADPVAKEVPVPVVPEAKPQMTREKALEIVTARIVTRAGEAAANMTQEDLDALGIGPDDPEGYAAVQALKGTAPSRANLTPPPVVDVTQGAGAVAGVIDAKLPDGDVAVQAAFAAAGTGGHTHHHPPHPTHDHTNPNKQGHTPPGHTHAAKHDPAAKPPTVPVRG